MWGKRRTARWGGPLLSAILLLTACTGEAGDDPAAQRRPPTPTHNTTDAPPAPPRTSPLTGEPVERLPRRRAVVVKVENTASSEPQRGLGAADLVVEELVEGGLTRLAAFFYSSLPPRVGPVRSVRGTDVGIVKPAKALLVTSGGAPRVVRRLRRARVVTATEGTRGFFRVAGRSAPYNLFVNLRRLPPRRLSGPRPPDYLPWGRAGALPPGRRARRVTARFSGASAVRWTWQDGVWRRAGDHAAKRDRFRPENLLVLRVRQVDAGYLDPAGNPVPESVLAGRGRATLFAGGRAYRGAWAKKTPGRPLRLATRGRRMPMPPGETWIGLVPASAGGVRSGR